MQIVYLGIVFVVIILLLTLKRPLYQAILGGLLATILFYRIPPVEIVHRTGKTITTWSSLSVLVSLYLITFAADLRVSRTDPLSAAEPQRDLSQQTHQYHRCLSVYRTPAIGGLYDSVQRDC